MRILYLTLKSKWYDRIASGEKPEEYREIKEFWAKRFLGPDWFKYYPETIEDALKNYFDYTHVRFARGGHFHPSLPQMTIELKSIIIGTGNPEWGAEPGKEYFVIKLGEILKSDTLIK